jgi:hypothetical protein
MSRGRPKGAADARAVRRKMMITAPSPIILAAIVLYALIGALTGAREACDEQSVDDIEPDWSDERPRQANGLRVV